MKKLATYTIIKPNKPDSHLSGGSTALKSIVKIIEDIGYKNTYISPEDDWIDPDEFDVILCQDIFNDPQGSSWFDKDQYFRFLNSNTKSIVMECAYTGCTEKPYGIGGKVNFGNYEPNQLSFFMKDLMAKSAINIFVSPLHKREFEKFLGSAVSNYVNYYQIVDTEIFNNKNKDRDIPFLFVGALNWFKGLDDVVNIFGDKGLHVVGRGHPSLVFPNGVKYLGDLKPNELADIYNRTINFVHMPRWQEPFGITVLEAALCGCNLILNENVGALSFGYDIRDPNVGIASRLDIKNRIKGLL